MKKNYQNLLGVALALLLLTGCFVEPEDKNPDTPGASIKGYVKHHNDVIPHSKVYIKYNATNFPGAVTSSYDDSTTADKEAYYKFDSLRRGMHYLYSVGFDSVYSGIVKGGIPVRVENSFSQVNTDIPVTE